jgi:hypothetical protein
VGCYREGGAMPAGLALFGDAYLDVGGGVIQQLMGGVGLTGAGRFGDDDNMDDFGVHFDGKDDYATISGVDSGYAADGTLPGMLTQGGQGGRPAPLASRLYRIPTRFLSNLHGI